MPLTGEQMRYECVQNLCMMRLKVIKMGHLGNILMSLYFSCLSKYTLKINHSIFHFPFLIMAKLKTQRCIIPFQCTSVLSYDKLNRTACAIGDVANSKNHQ